MEPLTILGGGPAGLAVAYYAHQARIPFVLYESAEEVGGLCRTYEFGDHQYDSGAHRFHDRNPEITRDVRSIVELHPVTSPSRVFTEGRFLDFPPTPLNLLLSSSPLEWGRIGLDLWRGRRVKRVGPSFQEFAVSRFGQRLAERFLLGYSAKVWGLPSDQLSVDVATRRLDGISFRTLLLELACPRKKAKHLDGHFLYPRKGFGEISKALHASLPSEWVQTGFTITGLEFRDQSIRRIYFASGRAIDVRGHVVSTIPLPLLVSLLERYLDDSVRSAARSLRFRHVRLVFLRLVIPRVSNNASIYFPDTQMCISRISEPKNRSEALAPPHETSLVAEVPCSDGDSLFLLSEESLKDRVVAEITRTGLIRSTDVADWRHHFLPYAYPTYSLNYRQALSEVLEGLQAISNLTTLGRNGRFFYSHMHDQLFMAKEFVSRFNAQSA